MALRAFDIPEATLAALTDLADITDVEGDDRLGSLMVDALRTYEWIIAQQVQGRTVAALEQADVTTLSQSERVSGERAALVSLIAPDKLREAQAYFSKRSCQPRQRRSPSDVS